MYSLEIFNEMDRLLSDCLLLNLDNWNSNVHLYMQEAVQANHWLR